jgi:hypothetical protein
MLAYPVTLTRDTNRIPSGRPRRSAAECGGCDRHCNGDLFRPSSIHSYAHETV